MKKPNCHACDPPTWPEWQALSDADRQLLDEARTATCLLRGQTIYAEEDPCAGIFCVASGVVSLSKTSHSGDTVILRIVTPGEPFGYGAFFSGGSYHETAEARTEARVCRIDGKTFRSVLERNSQMAAAFLSRLARDVAESQDEVLTAYSLSVRARLMRLILLMQERFAGGAASRQFDIPLSRCDLGHMIGARAESIARALRALEEDGLVQFHRRTVMISDPEGVYNALGAINFGAGTGERNAVKFGA